jgi:hypothetical protein
LASDDANDPPTVDLPPTSRHTGAILSPQAPDPSPWPPPSPAPPASQHSAAARQQPSHTRHLHPAVLPLKPIFSRLRPKSTRNPIESDSDDDPFPIIHLLNSNHPAVPSLRHRPPTRITDEDDDPVLPRLPCTIGKFPAFTWHQRDTRKRKIRAAADEEMEEPQLRSNPPQPTSPARQEDLIARRAEFIARHSVLHAPNPSSDPSFRNHLDPVTSTAEFKEALHRRNARRQWALKRLLRSERRMSHSHPSSPEQSCQKPSPPGHGQGSVRQVTAATRPRITTLTRQPHRPSPTSNQQTLDKWISTSQPSVPLVPKPLSATLPSQDTPAFASNSQEPEVQGLRDYHTTHPP